VLPPLREKGAGMTQDATACGHRWERLPIVDFSVTYRCGHCAVTRQAPQWMTLTAGDLRYLDLLFAQEYGGTTADGSALPSLPEKVRRDD
jgi:hypothetical protein